jgi:hypothetical protein
MAGIRTPGNTKDVELLSWAMGIGKKVGAGALWQPVETGTTTVLSPRSCVPPHQRRSVSWNYFRIARGSGVFAIDSCRLLADGETSPDATRDWYKACSAANQSMSGEPSGLPLSSQFWKASFATNSCRLSPGKSGVSSTHCCPSILLAPIGNTNLLPKTGRSIVL